MVTLQQVREKMGAFLHVPLERLEDDAALVDLVSESFILVQLAIELQEEFGVRLVQDDLKNVRTVADLANLIIEKGD